MAALEGDEVNSSATPETELDGKTLCSPCDTDGKRLEAIGYCVTCKEYLCETCFKYHRLPSITRKHVLLGQDEIKRTINTCSEHAKQAVEYHCPTHTFLGCHICFFQHQKNCSDSRYIPDVVRDLPSSEEFREFSAKLDYVSTKTKDLIIAAKQNLVAVAKRHAEEVAAVKAFKLQVLEAVERLGNDILCRADRLKQSEIDKFEEIIKKCDSIQDANLEISTEIEVLQNRHQTVDLYISMVTSKDKQLSLEGQVNAIASDSAIEMFIFERNAELQEIVKSPFGFGKLVHSSALPCAEHVTDINVKTGEDTTTCDIRGSALMPGERLVIGDEDNKKVKVVDTRKNEVVSEMTLSNSPFGITKVTDTTVAVTVPNDKKIVFVRADPALSVDRELDVREECHGVAYCDGRLFVTFRFKDMVQVLDLQGTVLREFQTDNNGKALFENPFAIAVSPNRDVMYVSNYGGDQDVRCIQLDGNAVATYKDDELKYPIQAVVDSTGLVFVAGSDSKNVHVITPDCKKIKVLLKRTDGLDWPRAISYDESRRRLYVGQYDNNMKVYRVTYAPLK